MGLTDAGVVIAQDYGSVTDQPPTITSTPSPSFTQGTSGTYDMTQHVSDDGLSTVTYSLTNTLPNGLVFNGSTGILSYDGVGAATVSAHTLVATDAVGSATSDSFNISVNATSSTDADRDFDVRRNAPGVVVYHEFSSDSEADQFRWAGGLGNDPGNTNTRDGHVLRITSDGVTGGGCLEILREAGTGEPPVWWRQFSPLNGASNGRGLDDPADDGSLTVSSFTPTNGGSQTQSWHNTARPGWYGDSQYHSGTKFDGTDFFFQMRVKADPRRTASGNSQVGKLKYLTATSQTLTDQELVTYSAHIETSGVGQPNYHRLYGRNFSPIENLDQYGGIPGDACQSRGDLSNYSGSYCSVESDTLGACWFYSGGWDTLLYHVMPGTDDLPETRLVVYAQKPGETRYTKLWDVLLDVAFEATAPDSNPLENGFNAVVLSAFNNGNNNTEFWHRYDQVILSKQPIARPLDKPTVLQTICEGLSAGQSALVGIDPLADQNDIQWQVRAAWWDAYNRTLQFMGKPATSQPDGERYAHTIYDEESDTFTASGRNLFPGNGHIWMTTFDPVNGDYYFRRFGERGIRWYDASAGQWNDTADAPFDIQGGGGGTMAYHPNLFGKGRPGIFVNGVRRLMAYDLINESWSTLQPSNTPDDTPYFSERPGYGQYIPAIDSCIIFCNNDNLDYTYLVAAGAGNQSNVLTSGHITDLPNPPVRIRGTGIGVNQGHCLEHPDDPNRLLILEEEAAGTPRVWDSTDYGATWNLKSYSHPFEGLPSSNGPEFGCGTISTHRVIAGLSSNGQGAHFYVWRPDD